MIIRMAECLSQHPNNNHSPTLRSRIKWRRKISNTISLIWIKSIHPHIILYNETEIWTWYFPFWNYTYLPHHNTLKWCGAEANGKGRPGRIYNGKKQHFDLIIKLEIITIFIMYRKYEWFLLMRNECSAAGCTIYPETPHSPTHLIWSLLVWPWL